MRMNCVRFGMLLLAACPAPAQRPAGLPPVLAIELKRLEETYRVLDFVAERIWPGWTGYRKVPFVINCENGLRLLIGHPNPPRAFEKAPQLKVEDREVFADWSAVTAKVLIGPLSAGGGLIPFGATSDGRPVEVVDIRLRSVAGQALDPEGDVTPFSTEEQITVYVHELFHCYQREAFKRPAYGNLRYNPDVTYAVYSELEGLALHRAYLEPDAGKAREHLKEFVAARRHKRSSSMTSQQQAQESSDELNEGTATYAQLRALEILRAGGYKPGLTTAEDPHYHGFGEIEGLLRTFPQRLLRSATKTVSPTAKSYDYGCFQAVLCDRLFPGWQRAVTGDTAPIDRELARRLEVAEEDWPRLERRLEEAYPFAEIQKRHAEWVSARDAAYRLMRARQGRVYVVSCKPVSSYLRGLISGVKSYQLGLIGLYPEGIGSFQFDEVELSGLTTPAETNQLYHLRAVDTEWRQRERPYAIEGARQEDGTWKNAIVRTPLFTLKAPHVQIQEVGQLVKIRVLARVKD